MDGLGNKGVWEDRRENESLVGGDPVLPHKNLNATKLTGKARFNDGN